MFTGIVEEVGTMQGVRMGSQSGEIHLQASKVLEGTQLGDSIAVKRGVSDRHPNDGRWFYCGCDAGNPAAHQIWVS